MITPGIYKIVCPQGVTFDRTFTTHIDGVLANWSGYTAAMQVRETYDSTATVVSLTNGSGITLGGTAGTLQVVISSTVTAGVAEGNYVYDIELTSNGGVVSRLLQGDFIVTPEVTR